uniref:Structural maintenance of chromosomes protein n=1 Tax=Odontella aurita TaxID=265563 RepID=A0A7S4I268_9STRA
MHIKQITISNFRSFRQQPEIHPFSAGTNVVVGRNGSGKSNLFDAVQFALLSPKFYSLRTEERQALLHEGSGQAAVNAFVEVVFDNSDNRFSMENSDEVVLRRTVGHKKDEFFLQRKRANKNEIMSLLEGAGFSKSNPYFIVQQGKVNALCTMSDAERLQLLKEVAGTTVYDEKKAESLGKMEENRSSIDKIRDILTDIESRLDELRGEKEELTRYQKLDRERRAVEYTLYDKELRRARETLDEIEHARTDEVEVLSQLHEESRVTHDSIRSVEATMKTKTNALRRNRKHLKEFEEDRSSAMTQRTKLDLECRELEEAVHTRDETIAHNKREIERLDGEIEEAEKDFMNRVQPKYDGAKDEVTRMTNEVDEARKKMEGLYAKQGRGRQFTTKEDRDAFLRSQIDDLRTTKSEKESDLSNKKKSLTKTRKTIEKETRELDKKTSDLSTKNATLDALVQTIEEKSKDRNEAAERRKEMWRSNEELEEKSREARENARRALSDMRKIMPRATSLGLDALTGVVEREGIRVGEQYFGLLMENMELTDVKYRTAVEVAAQNSLFHVIVDTDATAAKLMKRLEEDRLGRVTFLPLNRLNVENVTYPETSDVTPLLSRCVRYDPKVDVAMRHVFGRKLLARTVDAASTWSSQCHMDAITLDGDLCSRKGALTGGYVDVARSRLRAHAELREAEDAFKKADADHKEVSRKASAVDQNVTRVMGELQRLEAKRANLDHVLGRAEDDITSLRTRLKGREKTASQIEAEGMPPIETEIDSLGRQIERLEEEMGTALSANLTETERAQLGTLKDSMAQLEGQIEEAQAKLEEAGVERQRTRSLLDDNLKKRRQELIDESTGEGNGRRRKSGGKGKKGGKETSTTAAAQAQRRDDLELRRQELEDAMKAAEEIEEKLAEARKIDEELRSELIAAKNELEKLRGKDEKTTRSLEEAQEGSERLLNKRSMCISKRELYMRKIQELGSLPPTSELEQYTNLSIAALMRSLEGINKKLKKYSHVNKKAYDQYVNFSEQRESLLKRKEELDRGAVKVKELVESLDRKKDEAINRTFRGVSAHFKDVFRELVPNGAGELIMRTALDEEDDETDEELEDEESESEDEGGKKKKKKKKDKKKGKKKSKKPDKNNPSVTLYRGIGVKVRFSQEEQNYLMSQLSGGQKALVALALIFAIQRCDPAPFYLFDELDQALDSTYRAAVAALIERQANSEENPTQFICSTFRPELVSVANRCYGISHQNKVSNIHHLSKRDGLHFIANLMSEEEAVGEVTSLATSKKSGSAKSRGSRGSAKGGAAGGKKRKLIEQQESVEEESPESSSSEVGSVSSS